MKKRILIFTICSILSLSTGRLEAQSPKISLQETFQMVEELNPALLQSVLSSRIAKLNAEIASAEMMPELSVNGSYNYISEVARINLPLQIPGISIPEIEAGVKNQYSFSAVVQQPLFTGFRLKNQKRLAANRVRQSETEISQTKNILKKEAAKLFYQIHNANQQIALLDAGLNRVKIQQDLVRNLFNAGQAEAFDTLRMTSEYLKLFTQRNKSVHSKAILLARFNAVLNSKNPVDVGGYEKKSVQLPENEQSYFQEALSQRPEMKSLSVQKKSLHFSESIAKSAYFPKVFGKLSYNYGKPGINFFKDEWMNYYTVGVNLQWKLWDWKKTKKKIEQQQIRLNILNEHQNELILNIRTQVKQAVENLKSEFEVRALLKQILRQEKERYRIVKSKFEQGFATVLDLTDAENALRAAEIEYAANGINLRIQQVELDYVTGKIGQNK